jgi:hypothetical protein
MPLYRFEHPKSDGTGPFIDVFQKMEGSHEYVDEEGVEWKRVFTVPNAAVDTNTDPFDGKAFVNKTKNQKANFGDFFDQSKEASEKRKSKLGYDPVQRKYFKDWSKERQGKKHPKDKGE